MLGHLLRFYTAEFRIISFGAAKQWSVCLSECVHHNMNKLDYIRFTISHSFGENYIDHH